MGWAVFTEMPGVAHVVPEDDLIEHKLKGDECICGPRLDVDVDYAYGRQIETGKRYTHHSLDGREADEYDFRPPLHELVDEDDGA